MVSHGTVSDHSMASQLVSCRWCLSNGRALRSSLCTIRQPSRASAPLIGMRSRDAPRQAVAAPASRVETFPEAADGAAAPVREGTAGTARQQKQPVNRARFSSADNYFDRVLQGAPHFVLLGSRVVSFHRPSATASDQAYPVPAGSRAMPCSTAASCRLRAGYCRAGKLQQAWSLFTSAEAVQQEPHSYATYQGLITCAVKVPEPMGFRAQLIRRVSDKASGLTPFSCSPVRHWQHSVHGRDFLLAEADPLAGGYRPTGFCRRPVRCTARCRRCAPFKQQACSPTWSRTAASYPRSAARGVSASSSWATASGVSWKAAPCGSTLLPTAQV